MIRMVQKQLIIPRGDTGTFSVPALTTMSEGDASIFTIFNPLNHKKIFEKVMEAGDGALNLNFTHADTVNLPIGQFVWDIKVYKDAEIVDGVFINGTEINSYYAAFKLPICEIRQTGDALLTADDAPTSTISPEQLSIILAATSEINEANHTIQENTATAENAAQIATDKAAEAAISANEAADAIDTMRELIPTVPTKVSELDNDVGYITDYIEIDPTVPNWAKQNTKPSYTAQEVGAVSENNFNTTISNIYDLYSDQDTTPFQNYHEIGDLFIVNGKLYQALQLICPEETLIINQNAKLVTIEDFLANKADKKDTVLTSTLSRGRSANGIVGIESMAFGYQVTASGSDSIALGYETIASGSASMAVNRDNTSSGRFSFAEGLQTIASGTGAHSQGFETVASGNNSHAGGSYAQAQGARSLSYGYSTIAPYDNSVAFGYKNYVSNNDTSKNFQYDQHYNVGDIVTNYNENYICINENEGANSPSYDQTNWKKYTSNGKAAFYIGNGHTEGNTAISSNALKVDWDGNLYLNSEAYVNCNADSTGGSKLATISEIPTKISDLVDDSGHYTKPSTGIPAADLAETYLTASDLPQYATDAETQALITEWR